MLGLGILFDVAWMQAVGGGYLAFLWMPVTPEKIVTTIIAIFLLKWLFPKDEKTLGVLMDILEKAKAKLHRRGNKKKKEKKKVQSAETVGAIIDRPDEITLTRAEIDALNEHQKKVRLQTIKEVFDDVEELLNARKMLECRDTNNSLEYAERLKHFYAECQCVTLLMDLQKIRDKYMEVAEYNEAARECKEGVNNGFSSSVTDPKGDEG